MITTIIFNNIETTSLMTIDGIIVIISVMLIVMAVVRIYHVTTKDVESYQIRYNNYDLQKV